MKVLQVVSFFPPAWGFGGPVRHVYERSKALVDRGHHVTVCTTDAQLGSDGALNVLKNKPVDVEGIETYYFSNLSNVLAAQYHAHFPWRSFRTIHRIVKDYDIIHMQGIYSLMHMFTHHIAVSRNIPYILSPGNSYPPNKSIGRLRAKDLFLNFRGDRIVTDAHRIIALTNEERDRIIRSGVNSEQVIVEPFGMELTEFTPGVHDPAAFREAYGFSTDDLLILFVGRFHQGKGIPDLIETFAKLPIDLREKCRLVLVGPDSNASEEIGEIIHSSTVRDKIICTGLLSGERKFQAYQAADIFVLPSYSEQLPRVALEACASGTPVIITKESNVPEIEPTDSGYTYDAGDNDDLLEKMIGLLRNNAQRVTMASNGRKMIEHYYDWNPVIRRLETIYQDSITGRDKEM